MHRTIYRALGFTSVGLLPLLALAQDESLSPPFGESGAQTDPVSFIAVIIQALLGIVGAGALLMFVLGGFMMIFSGGNEERISKGKTILIWTTIGMAIILSSYAILSFTFTILQAASSN